MPSCLRLRRIESSLKPLNAVVAVLTGNCGIADTVNTGSLTIVVRDTKLLEFFLGIQKSTKTNVISSTISFTISIHLLSPFLLIETASSSFQHPPKIYCITLLATTEIEEQT